MMLIHPSWCTVNKTCLILNAACPASHAYYPFPPWLFPVKTKHCNNLPLWSMPVCTGSCRQSLPDSQSFHSVHIWKRLKLHAILKSIFWDWTKQANWNVHSDSEELWYLDYLWFWNFVDQQIKEIIITLFHLFIGHNTNFFMGQNRDFK